MLASQEGCEVGLFPEPGPSLGICGSGRARTGAWAAAHLPRPEGVCVVGHVTRTGPGLGGGRALPS